MRPSLIIIYNDLSKDFIINILGIFSFEIQYLCKVWYDIHLTNAS